MSTIRNITLCETAGSAAQNPNKPCPPEQPNCERKNVSNNECLGLKNSSSITQNNFAMSGCTKSWIA